MMAATTRSTGMTSMMPFGNAGNCLSRPLAYEMITGSAIRKPRIQPGSGSASADSMIDGRTIVTGSRTPGLQQSPLAQRLGVGVGIRPAQSLGPGLAGGDQAVLDPVLAESFGPGGQQGGAGRPELAGGPGAETGPASWGPGWPASASARARRAASTSGRHATSVDHGVSERVASGARPRRLPATYAVDTAMR